jgi:hypothetical protein
VRVHPERAYGLGRSLDSGGLLSRRRPWLRPGSLDAGGRRPLPQWRLLQPGSLDVERPITELSAASAPACCSWLSRATDCISPRVLEMGNRQQRRQVEAGGGHARVQEDQIAWGEADAARVGHDRHGMGVVGREERTGGATAGGRSRLRGRWAWPM